MRNPTNLLAIWKRMRDRMAERMMQRDRRLTRNQAIVFATREMVGIKPR